MGNRAVARLGVALALAGVVWVAAHYSWPWLAAVVSFLFVATLGALISREVPAVVERVAGTDPLNVAVGADIGFYSDGWSVVLPHDVDAQSTPATGLDDHLQARNHLFQAGAFDLRETFLLLTIEGRSIDPVRVTGLHSRVITRQSPLSGAVVRSPSAGEQQIVAAHFDLEQDEAPARSDGRHEYFRDYVLMLNRRESFMYRIIGRVERSTCEWELVLTYSHRDTEHELVIDNAGEPFRTAARSEKVAGANRRAVLYEGVHFGIANTLTTFSDADAQRVARQTEASWRRELQGRARRDPAERFVNLTPAELRQRLAAFSAKYGFKVVIVKLLRPRQLAPEVVIRTTHYVALAHATRLILRQIDPKVATGDDRTGWRFEGFYFQAEDERGVPFLAVFNFRRGGGGGGGQWARSDPLFPFVHG